MDFGGVIYLHDLSQPRVASMRENVMTPMKLSDFGIAPRVILATVDGNSLIARHRENQLKNITWQEVQTRQFTNTKDSAWSIVDNILGVSPTKMCYIRDKLDKIRDSLPKQSPKRRANFGFISRMFLGVSPFKEKIHQVDFY